MKQKGTIIILNGVSSSGKTTLAHFLFERLKESGFVVLSGDDFVEILCRGRNTRYLEPNAGKKLTASFLGMIRCLAEQGIDVIVDMVIQDSPALKTTAKKLVEFDPYLVALHCSPIELRRRESRRGDRRIGLVDEQLSRVHTDAVYDLELDTGELDVSQCGERILKLLSDSPQRRAVQSLKEKFESS